MKYILTLTAIASLAIIIWAIHQSKVQESHENPLRLRKAPSLHTSYTGWVVLIDFVILFIASHVMDALSSPYTWGSVALVSLAAWASYYRRSREIEDLPASKVASAAQGYVELFGRAEPLPGAPLVSSLSGQPCCWFRSEEEKRRLDGKRDVYLRTSTEPFLLVDDTGECVIMPEGADVLSTDYKYWKEGPYRRQEWLLLPGTALYAIGEFATSSAAPIVQRDENAYVSALINVWKKDPKRLSARFDSNRDGTIDLREWEAARLEAQRLVRQRRAQSAPKVAGGTHSLRRPSDGRLFLLADAMPDDIASRYRVRGAMQLIIFFVVGTLTLVMW